MQMFQRRDDCQDLNTYPLDKTLCSTSHDVTNSGTDAKIRFGRWWCECRGDLNALLTKFEDMISFVMMHSDKLKFKRFLLWDRYVTMDLVNA